MQKKIYRCDELHFITMSKITFKDQGSVSSTVNKLLESVLPGHSTQVSKKTTINSKSQIINESSSKKNLKPEEIRRLKKKERLNQRKLIKKSSQKKEELEESAKYELLLKHSKEGTLSNDEKIELKKLIKKNIINLQSWKTEIDEDLEEMENEITDLKKNDQYIRKRRRIPKRIASKEFYEDIEQAQKNQQKRYPGLTPGLAPVDMNDSDSE